MFGIGEAGSSARTNLPIAPASDVQGFQVAEEFTTIPAYQVFASAGHGANITDEPLAEPMAFRTDWLRREGFDPAKMAVIRAKGDSMEPTINDGDVILVRLKNGEAPAMGSMCCASMVACSSSACSSTWAGFASSLTIPCINPAT